MLEESKITFKLIESSRKKHAESEHEYRAVLSRDEPLGFDEVINECIRDNHLSESAVNLRRHFEMVLDSMIQHTLNDGRSRRVDGYFTLRMDIAGNFARPDAEFDPVQHRLAFNFTPAKRLRAMVRKSWPVNEQKRPHGKIDRVYSAPDGEIGKLRYGADIVIEGHDLLLVGQDAVHLFIDFRSDPFGTRQTTYEFGCDVKENTDTRLVVEFPKSVILKPELVIGCTGQICRFEFSKDTKKERAHGRRADVCFVEPIDVATKYINSDD